MSFRDIYYTSRIDGLAIIAGMRGTLGRGAIGLSVLLVGTGVAYALADFAFGGAVLWWSIMWGLMGLGVGSLLIGRWTALVIVGTVACSLSVVIIALWQRDVGSLGSWQWLCGGPAIVGVIYGAIVLARRARGDRVR